ncbi:BTAD domain-containing putative transcriptional regulator [Streptomyces sp. NPDC058000]|uniref:BTAD domain-containing putative transcriptional regulator n=1 Tax=Streptomyces sp. NPDC058000 TaxID=3346299 RepID=UPI0036E632F8
MPQAEAPTIHQEVRRRLADDCGVDPSSQLRATQREVLRQSQDVGRKGASGHFGDSPPLQPCRSGRHINSPLHPRLSLVGDR